MMESAPSHPVAILHVIHGMMEHSARYKPFTEWLAGRGIAVYMADLPGHGTAIANQDDLGHLDDRTGWEEILRAVRQQREEIETRFPGLPVVMLGHSFGSLVARSFVQRYSRECPLQGLILSGAIQLPSAQLKSGLVLVATQKLFYGNRFRSKLMISLGHGQYAKHYNPRRTSFDWLSSDPVVVDAYISDPLCGYACTLGYYRNFFTAQLKTWQSAEIKKMRSGLPVLFMGGKEDPVIRLGKDTHRLVNKYRQCGFNDVTVKLWENGRHEMLNEVNREEVWRFVGDWMKGFPVSCF